QRCCRQGEHGREKERLHGMSICKRAAVPRLLSAAAMSKVTVRKIAVIPGDGIGPEVIDAGLRVLNRVNDARNLGLELVHFGWNADEYLRTGISIPPGGMDDIRNNYAAVYLGAFGDPRIPDMKHAADILLGMRFQ